MKFNSQTPLRVAIVGSGPSGMYAADSLVKSSIPTIIDIFDRLPTPYGLLRGGVAPDHQKMKSLESFYDRIFTKNDQISFFGNVRIGHDISIETLKTYYDAIVVASGAESDRHLHIDGEDLPGSFAATQFVGWYNGHPDYQSINFNLNVSSVGIIGQGNVAIDVARILAKTPDELSSSDITENALSVLRTSQITDIHLIGRRGPIQAAFTELEIKELGQLSDCDVIVNSADLDLGNSCKIELESNTKAKKNYSVLESFLNLPQTGKSKRLHIHFFRSPIKVLGTDRVTGLELNHTELSGDPFSQKALTTTMTSTLSCDLLFRSVGYRGEPFPGLPFDSDRGVILNNDGQVVADDGSPVVGVFTVGWIKRGPSGVLGTNKPDSKQTIDRLINAADTFEFAPIRHTDHLLELLTSKGIDYVTFDQWKKIDQIEKIAGQKIGKPREKFISFSDLLNAKN